MMALPERKNPRLKDFDYSSPGAYFITICANNRRKLFSEIVGAIHESPLQSHRSDISKIIEYLKIWNYIDTNTARWEKDVFYTK